MTSSRYHVDERPHEPNNSHTLLLDLVGSNRRVLELGCSTGYMTQWLAAAGCDVTGVEVSPEAAEEARQWAQEVVVGDLDSLDLEAQFGDRRFEAVLCGDVLEHLRDPGRVLVAARRLLEPGGVVVASVPNVAHGDVRLELLAGRFEYRNLGLLDDTRLLTEAGTVADGDQAETDEGGSNNGTSNDGDAEPSSDGAFGDRR